MLEVMETKETALSNISNYFEKFKSDRSLIKNLITAWGRISNESLARSINWESFFSANRLDSQLELASMIASADLIAAENYATWLYSLQIEPSKLMHDSGILGGTSSAVLKLKSISKIPASWENWLSYIAINAEDAISTAPVLSRGLLNREWALSLAPVLLHWLGSYGKNLSTSYVYRSWLKALRNRNELDNTNQNEYEQRIEECIKTWLNIHQERFASSLVISAWIEEKYGLDTIQTAMQFWLCHPSNTNSFRAGYLYTSWLKNQGQLDTVAQAVKGWLNSHKNSSHDLVLSVFSGWIEATKKEHLENLNRQISDPKNICKYKSRSIDIQESLIQWLSIPKNRLHQRAVYIYWGWLEIESNIVVIRAACIEWLKLYGVNDRSTESLLSAYCRRLKTEPDALKVDDISEFINAWLNLHSDAVDTDNRARFLKLNYSNHNKYESSTWDITMQTRFKNNPNDPLFINGIIQYLKNETNDPEMAWPHLRSFLDEPIRRVQKTNGQMFKRWLERSQLSGLDRVRSQVINWLEVHGETKHANAVLAECLEIEAGNKLWDTRSLNWLSRSYQFERKDAFYIYRAWFRSNRPFFDIEKYFIGWINISSSRFHEKFAQLWPLISLYGQPASDIYAEFFPSLLA